MGTRGSRDGRPARLRGGWRATVLVAFAVTAALLLGGCSVEVGPTQEILIDEPLGAAALSDVQLTMGVGVLTIAPGAEGLASGAIVCNVESWVPEVVRTDNKLTVKQGSQKRVAGLGHDVVNRWDLSLGKAPMRLSISAGTGKGSYDLSGLTLQELVIKDGVADRQVAFGLRNPGQMSRFVYETGASNVTMAGLANANFKTMTFKGGPGTYSLDFSGQLRTDAAVWVESGPGVVQISVPQATAARVTIAVGAMAQGRMLDITLEMSVGSVTLVAR